MNVVLLSNYFSHHQKPLSDALAERCGCTFLATRELPPERRELGWGGEAEPDYVCHYDQEPERAEACLRHADVILTGSAPEALVRACILRNQLVLRYSERPLKRGPEPLKYLPRLVKWHLRNPGDKRIYLLCASGYAAADYGCFGLFRERAYRWGYFPETRAYASPEELWAAKEPASLLWAGRFLDWKHPEAALHVAAELKAEGIGFQMKLIGSGPMENALREEMERKGLADCVHLLGPMKPERVRAHMEKTQIFLFSSDRREGWGAVLNEAMNSCCAVAASNDAGATPYLIQNGENGLIFHSGDGLTDAVRHLLKHPEEAERLGLRAYRTIAEQWNADIAAERFLELARRILAGEPHPEPFSEGVCSREEI